jgi:hypothetical protein
MNKIIHQYVIVYYFAITYSSSTLKEIVLLLWLLIRECDMGGYMNSSTIQRNSIVHSFSTQFN